MDYTQPPSSAGPGKQRTLGCFGCLGVLLGLPLLLLLLGYYVVFHTSLPLKKLAESGIITSDGNGVELRGITGSISSGFGVEELTVYGETENSTISGLQFRYSGLWDSIRNRRFVIEELSVEGADIVLDTSADKAEQEGESGEDGSETDSSGSPIQDEDEKNLDLFELRELTLSNIRLRSTDGDLDIEIPLLQLAGLKIEQGEFDLEHLQVVSDHLSLELVEATPEQIDGRFTRRVEGVVFPKIHPLVKSDVDFSVEFASEDGEARSRITALGGAYQQTVLAEGSVVRFTALEMGNYFDTRGTILPERLTTTARQTNDMVEIEGGEFFLGKSRFEIPAQEIDSNNPDSAITSEIQIEGGVIRVRIRPERKSLWPPLEVELEAEPAIGRKKLLALVYFQRSYGDLSPEEKAYVDSLMKGEG